MAYKIIDKFKLQDTGERGGARAVITIQLYLNLAKAEYYGMAEAPRPDLR
tara:strand:+ start:345 stop:494 length:150 start_codon:yes stop_codon:yes gene_type:complete